MTSTESGTSSSSPNRSLLAQIGLLAGGVLGGLVVVGIGIFVWVLIARRRSKKKALLTPDDNTDKTRRRFHSGFSGSDVSSSSYEDTTITKVPITDLSSSSPTVVQLKPAARLPSKQRSYPSGLNAVLPDNRNSTGSSSTTTSSVASSSSSTIPTSPLTKSYVPLRRSPLASTVDNPDVRDSSSPSPDNYPTSSSSSEGSTTNPLSSKDRSPIPPPPTSSTPSSLPPSSVELVPGETEEVSGSSSSFDSLASPVNVGTVEANDVSVGCAV